MGAGILCNIIVRKTEAEAWAHAQRLLEITGAAHLKRMVEMRLRSGRYNPGLGTRETMLFDQLESKDPRLQARLDALKAGRIPDVRSLECAPNIWSGPNSWGALDVLDQGWGGYLVGSAENVAARMRELQEKQGIDAFILAGWPSLEESRRCAELLFPLLELDREPPKLRLAQD
jgi:alkanesulfonate monooxygenase